MAGVLSKLGRYVLNVLIAIDQLLNAAAWGDPDETLSSRFWRAKGRGLWLGHVLVALTDSVFFVLTFGTVKNHCEQSFEWWLMCRETFHG